MSSRFHLKVLITLGIVGLTGCANVAEQPNGPRSAGSGITAENLKGHVRFLSDGDEFATTK
jgi:hypothetical protein